MAFDVKFRSSSFFQRAKLLNAQQKKEESYLLRTGGFYRTVVKRSMRSGNLKRGSVSSEPGKPPRYHTKALRDGIYFQYEQRQHSVYVFARKLNGKSLQSSRPVPYLLEQGGSARQREYAYYYPGSQVPFARKGRGRVRKLKGVKTVRIRPRPFVGDRSINWAAVVKRMAQDRRRLGV